MPHRRWVIARRAGSTALAAIAVALVSILGMPRGAWAHPPPLSEDIPAASASRPVFCGHCGSRLGPQARYCGSCGQPVEQEKGE